jgi:hypothetical protein
MIKIYIYLWKFLVNGNIIKISKIVYLLQFYNFSTKMKYWNALHNAP